MNGTIRTSVMAAREQVLQGCLAGGVPRDIATVAADLALHAAATGLEATERVLDTLDGKEWMLARQIALQVIPPVAQALLEQMLTMAGERFGIDAARPHAFSVKVGQ